MLDVDTAGVHLYEEALLHGIDRSPRYHAFPAAAALHISDKLQ